MRGRTDLEWGVVLEGRVRGSVRSVIEEACVTDLIPSLASGPYFIL